jgi:hypothetical protein
MTSKREVILVYSFALSICFTFKMMARLLAFVVLLGATVHAGTVDHRYTKDEHVELWVNKVNILFATV